MKLMYVGNIVSMKVADELNLSIAGLKFALSICREFNDLVGESNFEIVSLSFNRLKSSNAKRLKLWKGKEYVKLRSIRYPVLSHLVQGIDFIRYLLKWILNNRCEEKAVILLNSPAHIAVPLVLSKIFFNVAIFSITIDIPFNENTFFKGLAGLYNKLYFKAGHLALKWFSGIFTFHKKASEILRLKIPCSTFVIGYDDRLSGIYHKKDSNNLVAMASDGTGKRKLGYAGTLIYYNGVKELIEGFLLLDKDLYELHIFGYGAMQCEIEKYCNMYTGIIFHGRLENNILFERIKDMDLLINPRLIDSKIKYFTFPSKIVEYILSGRPVLTTRFATLPGEYKKFVYFIDELTPMGIKTSIENVFNCSEEKIFNNCQRGLEFVRNHQDYKSIVKKMYQFIWGIKGYK